MRAATRSPVTDNQLTVSPVNQDTVSKVMASQRTDSLPVMATSSLRRRLATAAKVMAVSPRLKAAMARRRTPAEATWPRLPVMTLAIPERVLTRGPISSMLQPPRNGLLTIV